MKGRGVPGLSLKGRALRFLAAREHSRLELRGKLGPHAESIEQVDAVLDELEQKGFLSAQRFAESVIHRKASRYGTARLKAELQQHGLPDDIAKTAIATLQSTELARARAVWARRFEGPPASPEERARQMRFLATRGFSGEVIRQVLKAGPSDD